VVFGVVYHLTITLYKISVDVSLYLAMSNRPLAKVPEKGDK
jgi:hypothetical protein